MLNLNEISHEIMVTYLNSHLFFFILYSTLLFVSRYKYVLLYNSYNQSIKNPQTVSNMSLNNRNTVYGDKLSQNTLNSTFILSNNINIRFPKSGHMREGN